MGNGVYPSTHWWETGHLGRVTSPPWTRAGQGAECGRKQVRWSYSSWWLLTFVECLKDVWKIQTLRLIPPQGRVFGAGVVTRSISLPSRPDLARVTLTVWQLTTDRINRVQIVANDPVTLANITSNLPEGPWEGTLCCLHGPDECTRCLP